MTLIWSFDWGEPMARLITVKLGKGTSLLLHFRYCAIVFEYAFIRG
jgi:hypothetical protein